MLLFSKALYRLVAVEPLWDFPFMIVRADCPLCPHRKGPYRLARLAEKYGADIHLCNLMEEIAFDCPLEEPPWGTTAQSVRPEVHSAVHGLGSVKLPSP